MPSRELLGLALQRAPSLRPDERLLVWDLVQDESSFAALTLRDIEALVGRRLERATWTAKALLSEAESDARLLERIGARHILIDDRRYPPLLRETFRPPFGLYLRGKPLPEELPCAAVVGTRMPTGRGLRAAFDMGFELAAAGVPVVSGLARGIDSAAHRGALDSGGITCAVLPCGPDEIYPPANKSLAARILEGGGLLVTEYPPGSAMHKYRFPERNRIIAGMARACVVVEAPAGSGALITADHALQEGRDVWVAGECARGPRSAGSDRLAADGARELDGAGGLLADWGIIAATSARRAAPSGGREASRACPGGGAAASARGDAALAGRAAAAALRGELGLAECGDGEAAHD